MLCKSFIAIYTLIKCYACLKIESDSWQAGVTVGGHFDAVHDIVWEPKHGRYLLSVSTDQTTRLHSYWKHGEQVHWLTIILLYK